MRTGRPPASPEMQRAKGDPRKRGARVLEAEAAANAAAGQAEPEVSAPPKFEVPDFLTGEREREIFSRIVNELMPPNIIRSTDFGVVARYAAYMDRWIKAKETLGDSEGWYTAKSKHNPDGLLRRHPAAVDMIDYGAELIKLETMLGLTPLARQSLLRGLQSLPKGLGLFEPPAQRAEAQEAEADDATTAPAGPRGFLVPLDKLN